MFSAGQSLSRKKTLLIQAAFLLVFLEIGSRILPKLVAEPLRSSLEEAVIARNSALRRFGKLRQSNLILLPEPKQADVLFVGDSFPFGDRVLEKDSFPAVYSSLTGRSVLNLGVQGTTPPQYNRMLEVGFRYRPKAVVYSVFANDFVYPDGISVRELSAENSAKSLEGDDGLFVEHLSLADRLGFTAKAAAFPFHTVQLAKDVLLYRVLRKAEAPAGGVGTRVGNNYFYFMKTDYWTPQIGYDTPAVQRATDLNARFIEAAKKLADSAGIPFLVVLIPSKEMVYAPLVEHPEEILADSHLRTYRELEASLTKAKIRWLDATDALREDARKGKKVYFSLDGHFTEEGHRSLAELISRHSP